MKTLLQTCGFSLRHLNPTRIRPVWALIPVVVVFATGLAPTAARAESGVVALAAPLSAKQAGKWRTTGPFALYVGGNKVIGGDGPTWVSFRTNGSMIAEGDKWVTRWKKSGKRTHLLLNREVFEDEFGTIDSIRHKKSSLSFSGKSVSGNIDCQFKIRGVPARFQWKFEGRRM